MGADALLIALREISLASEDCRRFWMRASGLAADNVRLISEAMGMEGAGRRVDGSPIREQSLLLKESCGAAEGESRSMAAIAEGAIERVRAGEEVGSEAISALEPWREAIVRGRFDRSDRPEGFREAPGGFVDVEVRRLGGRLFSLSPGLDALEGMRANASRIATWAEAGGHSPEFTDSLSQVGKAMRSFIREFEERGAWLAIVDRMEACLSEDGIAISGLSREVRALRRDKLIQHGVME